MVVEVVAGRYGQRGSGRGDRPPLPFLTFLFPPTKIPPPHQLKLYKFSFPHPCQYGPIPSIAAPAEAEAAEKVRDFRVPVGAPAGVGQGGELRLVGWGAKNSGLVASCGRLAPTRRPR